MNYHLLPVVLLSGLLIANQPMQLMQAAGNGDLVSINQLLDAGEDVNATTPKGETALFTAAHKNQREAVKLLLKRGAKVNGHGPVGHPALTGAIIHDDLTIAKLLIDQGADVNAGSGVNWTPLHEAAHGGKIKAIELLLEAGADIDARTVYDESPMLVAAREGHLDVINLLLSRGVDANNHREDMNPFVNDGQGQTFIAETALSAAAKNGHRDAVMRLVDAGAQVNSPGKVDSAALTFAITNGDAVLAKWLLAKGAEINVENSGLALAAKRQHAECVQLLLSRGARLQQDDRKAVYDTTLKNNDVNTYLALRAYELPPPAREPGDDPDAMQRQSLNLMRAAHAGNSARVDELIEQVMTQDPEAVTIAHRFAVQQGRIDLIRAMKDGNRRAESLVREAYRSQQRMESACRSGNDAEVEKYLTEGADARRYMPMMWAIKGGHDKIVALLLKHGASKSQIGSYGESPLVYAVSSGHVAVGRVLLDAGTSPHAYGSQTRPLCSAAYGGHVDFITMLLDAGAIIDDVDNNCVTPLMHAAKQGHIEAVRLLLKHGANADLADCKKRTARWYAESYKHAQVAALLPPHDPNNPPPPPPRGSLLAPGFSTPTPERMRELIKLGADSNEQGNLGRLPLENALDAGATVEKIKILIDAGADVRLMPGALCHVSGNSKENIEIAKMLIDAGADVNQHGHVLRGGSPLIIAATMGSPNMVEFLIENGAKLDAVDSLGRTAIEAARDSNYISGIDKHRVIQLLEEAAAKEVK